MILLVDADSLIFAACYKKREHKDGERFYTDIEDCKAKFDEQFMSIVNKLEDMYPVERVITFSGSKGNFRKLITPVYKANRKVENIPPLLNEMHQFGKDEYDSVWGYGIETDDIVARYWYNLSNEIGRDNVMIVSIDKDYKQFPCLIYNYHYKHKVVLDISEEEALYNFYEQMIVGDTADNIKGIAGRGVKYAEKYLADCNTKYQYTRKMLELFQEKYKGKAR